jgi:hypothetical protein
MESVSGARQQDFRYIDQACAQKSIRPKHEILGLILQDSVSF